MIHNRIAEAQMENNSSSVSSDSSDENSSISDNSVANEIPDHQSLNTACPKPAKINSVENTAPGPSCTNPTPGPFFTKIRDLILALLIKLFLRLKRYDK